MPEEYLLKGVLYVEYREECSQPDCEACATYEFHERYARVPVEEVVKAEQSTEVEHRAEELREMLHEDYHDDCGDVECVTWAEGPAIIVYPEALRLAQLGVPTLFQWAQVAS